MRAGHALGATLDDEEILTLLQDYNAGRPIIDRPH
jgi:hypothetical protein